MAEVTLPVFKLTLSEEKESDGVHLISLVEYPAHKVDWVAFADQVKFAAHENSEQRCVTGPVMIPDQMIPRFHGGTEYLVYADSPTIRLAAEDFLKNGRQNQTNLEHSIPLDKNFIVETWFIEGENDKSRDRGFNLPVGTWMATMKVEDDKTWELVKNGTVKGFSIEGFFSHVRVVEMAAAKQKNTPQLTMLEKLKKVKEDAVNFAKYALGAEQAEALSKVEFADQKLTSGETVVINDETKEVRYLLEDGNLGDPLADGSHTLENGETINVKDGFVTEEKLEDASKDAPAQEEVKAADEPAKEEPAKDENAERIAALEATVASLAEQLQSLIADQTEVAASVTKMSKAVETIATAPAVPVSKSNDKNTSALSLGDREKNYLMNS